MNTPNLSIIIINWRSQAFVRDCLTSICANIGSLTHEILVVDNASFDGCDEMVRSEFPHVLFIQSEHNLGFAAANNLAFACSSGRVDSLHARAAARRRTAFVTTGNRAARWHHAAR